MQFSSLVIHLCSALAVLFALLLFPVSLQSISHNPLMESDQSTKGLANNNCGNHLHRHHHHLKHLHDAIGNTQPGQLNQLKHARRHHKDDQNGIDTEHNHKGHHCRHSRRHRRPHHHRHHHQAHCRQCQPGQYVQHSCNQTHNTVCASCPERAYNAHNSLNRECIPCSECGTGLYVLHKCTPISDTMCNSCQAIVNIKSEEYLIKCT